MTYNGFEINDRTFAITKNGRPVFHGRFTAPISLDDAKNVIDASNIAKAVFDKFPNITAIDLTGICELENGSEAADDAERWANDQAENQLFNQ